MVKRKFITTLLRQGESLGRDCLNRHTCLLVLNGRIAIFNNQGKMVLNLDAGEANVFDGYHEFTGTAVIDTEVIIV